MASFGIENQTDFLEFEKPIVLDNNNNGRIDVYIPETKVLIEQKKIDVDLDKVSPDGKWTPYQQAKAYSNALPYDEKTRWIITCNFNEFHIYDLNSKHPEESKQIILLKDLPKQYYRLNFLVDYTRNDIPPYQQELSIKAGEIVKVLYESLRERYNNSNDVHSLESLNQLCVRIVFCLFAEDAGLFGSRTAFHDYLSPYPADAIRGALIDLFNVLDTKEEERNKHYFSEKLESFPYVNGGLFSNKNIEIPQFTEEIKELILQKASAEFDWSDISPTIFGAVFESTLNPETRRSGGMHYTSVENIHKVIDPLFLNDLRNELKTCKTKQLENFQDRLSKLTFLDPACGSGNFLTETYISLRELENEAIKKLQKLGQAHLINPIKVSINQFYGIEINDFAVSVAKTALWIAELQMQRKTSEISQEFKLDYLPLKEYTNIHEANALRIDWNDVIPADKLNYIISNPPFVGARQMKKGSEQKKDIKITFGEKYKGLGNLDYVACWFLKSAKMMQKNNKILASLVSTNSITQGEQVSILWNLLIKKNNIKIDFAWRTFKWDSESNSKAHVHCVIIGFSSRNEKKECYLYDEQGNCKECENINPYLIECDDIIIEEKRKTLFIAPKMIYGNSPIDNKGCLSNYSVDEKNKILNKYPEAEKYFRRIVGSEEFINNEERWCLWLLGANPADLKKIPPIYEAVQNVKGFRLNSTREATRKLAEVSYLFGEIRQKENENYMIVPSVSSENRKYIPMGFIDKSIIVNAGVLIIPKTDMTLYHFGVLTSVVHMAWMRVVAGRLELRYRYSGSIVYNNFPWIENATEEQKVKIEKTAQAILDARALYPNSSLADLYDDTTMPIELRKAHNANDKEVLKLYGMKTDIEEDEIVSKLFKMYKEKLNEVNKKKNKKK